MTTNTINKKLLKGALITLLVSSSAIASAQSLTRSSGPLSFVASEFSSSTLNYPTQVAGQWRAVFNETRPDRMFMNTFQYKVPRGCKVVKANFQISMKNLGAQNRNDALYMTNPGGANLFSQKIWTNEGVGAVKNLSFNLGNLPSGGLVTNRPSASILHTLNDGKFSIFIQDDTAVRSVRLNYQLAGGKHCGGSGPIRPTPGKPIPGKPVPINNKKGMTWAKKAVDPITGVVTVGCKTNGYNCNPSVGDQSCAIQLPMLCKRKLGLPKPSSVSEPDKYNKWSGNVVGTTRPVSPLSSNINTKSKANNFCRQEFGNGWTVAGHHDAWGWNFKAYGNVGTQVKRFWVNIKDKPNGNCWTQQ